MESVLYNVSFWLIVNVFLAAAVVGLILIRYSLTRSTPKTDEARAEGMDFSPELETFPKTCQQGGVRGGCFTNFRRLFCQAL
jgi:uncharacterized membrane protein